MAPARSPQPAARPSWEPIIISQPATGVARELEALLDAPKGAQGTARRAATRVAFSLYQLQLATAGHEHLLVMMGMRWRELFDSICLLLQATGSQLKHDKEEEWHAACNLLQHLPPALFEAFFASADLQGGPAHHQCQQLVHQLVAVLQHSNNQSCRDSGLLALLRVCEAHKNGAALAVQASAHKVLLRHLDRPEQDIRSTLTCLYYLAADAPRVQALLLKYGLLSRILRICRSSKHEALYEAVQVLKMLCNSQLCCAAVEAAGGRHILAAICSSCLHQDTVQAAQVALKRLAAYSTRTVQELHSPTPHKRAAQPTPAGQQRTKSGTRCAQVAAAPAVPDLSEPRTPVRTSPLKGSTPATKLPSAAAAAAAAAAVAAASHSKQAEAAAAPHSSTSVTSLTRPATSRLSAAVLDIASAAVIKHQSRSLPDAHSCDQMAAMLEPLTNPGAQSLKKCLSMTHTVPQSTNEQAGEQGRDAPHAELASKLLKRGSTFAARSSAHQLVIQPQLVGPTDDSLEGRIRFFELVSTKKAGSFNPSSVLAFISDEDQEEQEQAEEEVQDLYYLPLPPHHTHVMHVLPARNTSTVCT